MKKKKCTSGSSLFILVLTLLCGWQMAIAATPVTITASDDDGHIPENTMDDDLSGSSRWSAQGDGQWIRYDFGHSQSLKKIRIAFYKGNKRKASIQIQSSDDAVTWVTYVATESRGNTTSFEDFFLGDISARYFRIVGFGNEKNDWTSITEVEFVGSTSNNNDFTDSISEVTTTASDYDNRGRGYPADNAIDNSLNPKSRWSAQGNGQWLQLDSGQPKNVAGVAIAFYKGNKRTANFTLQTSLDAVTWTTQLDNQISSGTTLDYETFTFPEVYTQYVRVVGYGNSSNDWNSIVEIFALDGSNTSIDPVKPVEDPMNDSGNFNLKKWKLTLPVSQSFYYGNGRRSTAEILPYGASGSTVKPLNEGFEDGEFFFINKNKAMVFRTALTRRGTTTPNSSYVRTELRELYDWTPGQSSGSANWNNEGSHKLEARLKVVEYWTKDPQTVVGQIHAKNSKKALIKLQWDGPNKPVRAIINENPKSGKPFSLYFDVVGTAEFNYEISLNDNTMSITVNGLTQSVTFGENGMSASWDKHVFFFKAGNYPQADKNGGGFFEVHFFKLKIAHS